MQQIEILATFMGDYVHNNPKKSPKPYSELCDVIGLGRKGYKSDGSPIYALYVQVSAEGSSDKKQWKEIGFSDVDFDGDGKTDKAYPKKIHVTRPYTYPKRTSSEAYMLRVISSSDSIRYQSSALGDVNGDGIPDNAYKEYGYYDLKGNWIAYKKPMVYYTIKSLQAA